MGDLALKLLRHNSKEPIIPDEHDGKPAKPFLYDDLPDTYSMRIAGHSHSPLFVDDTKELAAFLTKAQLADGENVLRLLNPPNRDALIRGWRNRQKAQAQKAAAMMQMGFPPEGPPRSHKRQGGIALPPT
jgi:hypothetical protein